MLDSSIPLQVKGYQPANPLELAGQGMQLRHLGQQMQLSDINIAQHARALQESTTIADLIRSSIQPGGTIDHSKVIQGLANAGLGDRVPKYQAGVADAEHKQGQATHVRAQTGETELKTVKMRLDITGGALNALLADPNLNHDKVINTVVDLVDNKVMTR